MKPTRRISYITSAGVAVDPDNIIVPAPNSSGNVDPATPPQRTITAATDTITQADNGYIIRANRATGQTLTPTGPFAAGFNCLIIQVGAGTTTFAAGAGGATVHQRQSFSASAGQWAIMSLVAETADSVVLGGDLA